MRGRPNVRPYIIGSHEELTRIARERGISTVQLAAEGRCFDLLETREELVEACGRFTQPITAHLFPKLLRTIKTCRDGIEIAKHFTKGARQKQLLDLSFKLCRSMTELEELCEIWPRSRVKQLFERGFELAKDKEELINFLRQHALLKI